MEGKFRVFPWNHLVYYSTVVEGDDWRGTSTDQSTETKSCESICIVSAELASFVTIVTIETSISIVKIVVLHPNPEWRAIARA